MADTDLTGWELQALTGRILNLADGHARQSLSSRSVQALPEMLRKTLIDTPLLYPQVEERFLTAFSAHTGQDYARHSPLVHYSSSVSLDIVAKHLRMNDRSRVGLVTPTFDSIPDLLRLAGLQLVPVTEDTVFAGADTDRLNSLRLDALIVVAPNNPTGASLTRGQVADIIEWAARADVQIIFDLSFRLLDPHLRFDFIDVSESIGAQAITIDDTGKILPLHDSKVGILCSTAALRPNIHKVHTSVLLNVSSIDLELLRCIIDGPDNEVDRARRTAAVNWRHASGRLDFAFDDPRDSVPGEEFCPSVGWCRLPSGGEAMVERCRRLGLAVLPGRHFHWEPDDRHDSGQGRQRSRCDS